MSGGALDYFWTRIDTAVEDIRAWVERGGARYDGEEPTEEEWTPHPRYVEEHPDKDFLKGPKELRECTLGTMLAIATILEYASKLGKEAEWLMSDDNGPEAFCLNTEEACMEYVRARDEEEKRNMKGEKKWK